jgi:hypothetical protein
MKTVIFLNLIYLMKVVHNYIIFSKRSQHEALVVPPMCVVLQEYA